MNRPAPAPQLICGNCAFVNPEGMGFCGRCGTPLAAVQTSGTWQERRRLTVLFCDLVGSTALSERMDIEDFEDLLRRYQESCTAIVRAHGGFVARYVGDALLVYFGYPRALEEAPAQAVRAALAIVAAVVTLESRDRAGAQVVAAVRVGIATGDVVVGDLIGQNMVERAAVRGLTPNLAAKLQSAAAANTILISEDCRRRLPPGFDLLDLGPMKISGLEHAERVFQVQGERQDQTAGFAAHTRGTVAVGRDHELARLQLLWERARHGGHAIAAISGEPGIGKSRLVRDLRDRLRTDRKRTLILTCSPNHRDTAFYPLATELRRVLRIGWSGDTQPLLARLELMADAAGLSRAEAVPLLADLFAVSPGPAYPRQLETVQRRRERQLDLLTALLRTWLGGRPLLVVLEDAQWADPSTSETMAALAGRLSGLAYLGVATHRSEHAVAWLEALDPEVIALGRLDPANSAGLALAVTGAAHLPPALLTGIVERADGVPLFIEELVKNAIEVQAAASAEAQAEAIPASLQESLVARLDRMADGKTVAQVAAVIGRRFNAALLERVSPVSVRQLRAGLTQLVMAGLISEEDAGEFGPGGPGVHYVFRHALVRDTAYGTLLMRVRRRLHHDVANALADRTAGFAAGGPEIMAQHLSLAEDWPEAVAAWLAAGQRSYQRQDLAEAMVQFRHGLDLLGHLSDPMERHVRELALRAGFGAACMLLRGYAAPEVELSFNRAYELTGDIIDPQVFAVIWGVWAFQISSRRNRFGEEAANRLTAIAQGLGDRQLRLLAHTAQTATRVALGELERCEHEARSAMALHDPTEDRDLAVAFTVDPKALSMMFLAHALWVGGRTEEAEALGEACLAFVEGLGHAFVVPYVLVWGGVPLVYAGRWDEAIARMQKGVALAHASRLDLWTLTGELWRGAALIGRGDLAEGATLLKEQLAIYRMTGVRLAVPYLQAFLATALARLGQIDEARALADEAAAADCGTDGLYAAETGRLCGQVLLAMDPPDYAGAAGRFRTALEVARRQGAKAWEERAADSLAELEARTA
jgi:class 3 adenylate cyclase/predicted ATPase